MVRSLFFITHYSFIFQHFINKGIYSDYYSINRKADNYLLTILNILEKRDYYDTEPVFSINSILKLFPNREEEKIITFAKKI